jgi:xanthine dehydrogenase accessory factor
VNDNEFVSEIICRELSRKAPVVMASIVSLQGSSPRHNGTKMVIAENGISYGTIGGSLLEATSIQKAKSVLEQKRSRFLHFDLTGQGAYSKGMICGGKAVILLDHISPNAENLEFFQTWSEIVSKGQASYLITSLKSNKESIEVIGRAILLANGDVLGQSHLLPEDIEHIRSEARNMSMTSLLDIKNLQVVVDPIRKLKTVYCFGAGHVAVPIAKIAALTGFRVVIIDDRAEFANAERFPDAYQINVIDNFEQGYTGLEIDSDSFIVIVTRGHQFDRIVLEKALQTSAAYIGMISSRKKRDSIFDALLEKGVNKEALDTVHSPIGIKIGGESPEEIAVSIVAELISERSKMQGAA